jgi:CubicO group peptidase (beta-lactamase class C family)
MKRLSALLIVNLFLAGVPAGVGQTSCAPIAAAVDTTPVLRTAFTQADTIEFEKTINAEIASAKIPGAAVAVVVGDKVVYAKGFGRTSVEGGPAVTEDTLFRIGSATKMFTAAAFAELTAVGRARFDSPISTYLTGLSPKLSKLTAHQLLSQSSGIRDFVSPVTSDDDDALARSISGWKDDVFFTEPNKIYSYSSANFWLAGLMVERINGKAYSDSMAELVFRPLGMTRTTFRPSIAMTYPLALGHANANGNLAVVRPIDNNVAKYPGGSIYSNVVELSRFAIAMLNGGTVDGKRALSPITIQNLQKPQFYLPGEEKAFYGYGLLGYDIRGVKTVSHGGVSRGYGSTIAFAPEHKFAVIVLTNSNGQTLPKTRQKALEMFLPLGPESSSEPAKLSAAPDELARFAGTYAHAPQTWKVVARSGELFIETDGKEFRLTKTAANEFSYDQGQVLFVPNGDGRVEHIFMGLYAARRVDDTRTSK